MDDQHTVSEWDSTGRDLRSAPSRRRSFLWPILIIIGGLIIGPGGMVALIFSTLISAISQGQQFAVPGQIVYQVP